MYHRKQVLTDSHNESLLLCAAWQTGKTTLINGFIHCDFEFSNSDFEKWHRFSSREMKLTSIKNCSHYEIAQIWNDFKFNINL
jgi:hypothetical protein